MLTTATVPSEVADDCNHLTTGHIFADHHEHKSAEVVPYEYLRIRRKAFPWGDQSLFHNPDANVHPIDKLNALKPAPDVRTVLLL